MRRLLTRGVAIAAVVAVVLGVAAVPVFASVGVSVGSAARSFSPNGDGQEDTVDVGYFLAEASNLDVNVLNAANATVRVLASGVSQAAGNHSVTWDGKNTGGAIVADGSYTLAFHAEAADGTDNATYTTAVDTRVPGVLNQPHPGDTLSGTQSFVFTPTAGFSGINSVAVDCIGQANAPEVNGTFTASGDTSTLCQDGSHTIAAHVSFTDGFGAAHSWNSNGFDVTVQQPVRVAIDNYGFLPSAVFSPNGDGQDDSVTTGYCLSRTAMVSIVVKNASDVVVRTLQPSTSVNADGAVVGSYCRYVGAAGQALVTWDGKNDANAVVADGDYTIVVDAQDAQGNTARAVYDTAVDTRVPGTITTPASGATVSRTGTIVFTPTAGFDALANVWAGCFGALTLQGNGTWTGSSDSASCPVDATSVSAQVSYADKFGTAHYWQSPTTPVTFAVQIHVTSQPRAFSPDSDGQEDSVITNYCLSRDATVTVTVHNAANALVRTLESNVAHSAGFCTFGGPDNTTWDGKNTAGTVVADGDYTIDIHALDGNGHTDDLSVPTAVDTRAPGTLTTPASSATLTGTANFVFTPTSGFTGISSVSVDCLGGGTLQGDGTWTGSGDTSTCGPNTTSLAAHVSYSDQFASVHTWQSPGTPVTIAIQLTRADASRSFSPDADGQEDSVTASYCSTGDATMTITVHNAAHVLVRTLESGVAHDGIAGCGVYVSPHTTTWDGKNAAANVVPDGAYTIDIHAVDSHGNTDDLSIPTTVDTRVPGTLTTPASGATLTGTANFVFTPTSGFTGIYYVYVDCLGGGTLQGNGTWTGSADTSSCGTGPTSLHTTVGWIDGYGSYHLWISPAGVPVDLDNLQVTGQSGSRSFSPNGDGNEDSLTTNYCLTGDATVTITVHDAAHALVRTLETDVAHTGGACNSGQNSTTWDGKDSAGDVVADGDYTIDLHVVSTVDSSSADGSIPTTVITGAPGQLTEPFFAETLQGLMHFSFTPAGGFTAAGPNAIDSVQGCFSNAGSNNCISIVNASPDGVWRTTKPSSDLPNGAADFSWSVNYHDTYGAAHLWNAPVPVAVSINTNPNPVLALGASPSNGPAPLATTLHFDVSDQQNRPLAYTANFGDGSSAVTGTVLSPYTGGVSLAHTYAIPGSFLATVSISNGAGGSTQKSVTVTVLGTEQPPAATLAVSPSSGVAPAQVTATISATDSDTSNLTYSLDFGDGSAATTGTLPDGPVDHSYSQAGTFTVRLAVSDGVYTDVRTRAVSIGLSGPLTAKAGDDQTAIVNQPVHFDGAASRPLVGITSYSWNFGGANTATGAQADFTFTTTGTKTVTLTVHAGAAASTDTMTVFVAPAPATPGLHVTVTGGSAPVQGADVAVIDADGIRHAVTTDTNGSAHITGLSNGKYTVYAWHDGFFPATGSATLAAGNGSVTIALAAGSVAETSLTSERLDRDQIIAAGIDPDDPANQNVYQFEIHLAFFDGPNTYQLALGGYATGNGIEQPNFGGGGGGVFPRLDGSCVCADIGTPGDSGVPGGVSVSAQVQYVGSTPTILWMVIPGRAKWLKEFFNVRLLVTNLGSSDFSFEHGTASLGALPDGLSLAPTAAPQSLAQTMPDIPGGKSAEVDWVIRGDTEGFYTLGAQYSGSLEPVGAPIHLVASTPPDALHVWGGSALHMIVDADNATSIGAPYRVRIGLRNDSNVPVYNPSVELLESGRLNYIYQPGEKMIDGTDAVQPGATFYTHYFRLVSEISGTLNLNYSFVKKTAGNTDVSSTIVSHAAVAGLGISGTHSGTALTLTWSAPPVSGITGYRVYFTTSRDTPFGSTPLTTTGAGTRTATLANAAAGYYAVSTLVNGVPTMFHTLFGLATSPRAPIAVPGNTSATVRWMVPETNGGSAITAYVVTPIRAGTAQPTRVFNSTATTQTITGLLNGASYTFKIAARTANGTGPQSPASAAITVGAPVAPTGVTVRGNSANATTGSVTVSFAAGADNGAAITKFTATCTSSNSGVTKTGVLTGAAAGPITVAGITTAKTYTCKVTATNSRGTGPASAPSSAVIVGAPAQPAQPTVSKVASGSVKVTFTAPANNGAAITGYTATCTSSNGGVAKTKTSSSGPITVTGLSGGKSYTCTVSATNARGPGPPLIASIAVTA